MATIHKLTKDGATIFPATITDAVVHQDTGKTLTSMIKEYNVSELFPTEGIAGGNTYNLALAVQVLGTHLRASEKTGGIKLTFISSVSGCEEEYYLGSSSWSSSSANWKQRFEVGDVVADPSGSWEPSTAEQYIDQQIGIEASTRLAQDTYIQSQIPLADEEDITKSGSYLKFKDRIYNQVSPNGMGCIYLRKEDNFKTVIESVTQGNTIFVIKYDFTLTSNVTIPANCVLEFDGGSISGNGTGKDTITGTNTGIQAGLVKVFDTTVTLAGTWSVTEAYPEWFGAKGDGVSDDSSYIAKCAETGVVTLATKKVYKVASIITFNRSVSIFGFGRESVLRLHASIKTDTDNSHSLEICDCRVEVYMTTGNAIEVVKNTDFSAPSSAINIHDVYFYFRNNVLDTLDSVVIYIKGIQGANIHNCTFKGDGKFGTFIEMSASNTQPTENTTINGCYFSNVKYGVKLETTSEYTVYLCGIRLVNNGFLGCTYGIFAKNVDNLLIADSMLDYDDNPIIANHVQSLWIHHNYIQTIVDWKACIECEPGGLMRQMRIDNNSLWQAANGRTVDGIRLKGTSNTDMFMFFFICYNDIRDLDNFLVLDYCNHGIIDGNICQTTNTFCKGASYMINNFIGNKCEGVTNFFKSFNPSNRIFLNISGNTSYAYEDIKDVTFDGVTRHFEYPVNVLGDNIEYYDINIYSTYDIPSYKTWFNYSERKFIVEFSSAPANGVKAKVSYSISSY